MKSKFSLSYVAIAGVVLFSAWVYIYEFKGGETREKEKAIAAAGLPFSNVNVTEFQVKVRPTVASGSKPAAEKLTEKRTEKPTETLPEVVVKKDGEIWKVEKPYIDLGDPVVVDTFLSTVSAEKINEVVVEGDDISWKTYGLESPAAVATFRATVDGAEKTRNIEVGSVLAFDGSVYVRIDGANRVQLMSSTMLAALQKDARDFRDKRFFPSASVPTFSGLEVKRQGAPLIKLALKNDLWVEAEAKAGSWPLDQAAVKSYVQSVSGLRGNDVWAEDKTDPKVIELRRLNRPGLTIRLNTDKDERLEVSIARLQATETVAAGIGSARPLVFSVFKNMIDSLSVTIDSFRDMKYPFQFKISDVRFAELERPKGEVSLPLMVKKDGKWLIDPMDSNFQKREIKAGTFEKLLSDLESLSAQGVAAAERKMPKFGGKGSMRITLFAEKNRKYVEFIFEPSGEKMLVSSSKIPGRSVDLEKAKFENLSFDLVQDLPAVPTPPEAKLPTAPESKGAP